MHLLNVFFKVNVTLLFNISSIFTPWNLFPVDFQIIKPKIASHRLPTHRRDVHRKFFPIITYFKIDFFCNTRILCTYKRYRFVILFSVIFKSNYIFLDDSSILTPCMSRKKDSNGKFTKKYSVMMHFSYQTVMLYAV